MAKDMLDAVRAAEEEAQAREEKAAELAAEKTARAKSDAAAMIGDRKKAAEQNAERELDEARARLDKKSEAAAAEAQKQCGEISALAEKNRGAVIKKAAELLRHSDLTVTEIALQLGYSNRTLFYNAFERAYGETPRQYRLRHLAEREKARN